METFKDVSEVGVRHRGHRMTCCVVNYCIAWTDSRHTCYVSSALNMPDML